MPQPIWSGCVRFGLIEIPVELYAAERKAAELPVQILDRRDLAPVGYRRVNRRTGDIVPWDAVVRGYEYEPDRYVVLTDADLERAGPEARRTIELVAFVDEDAIEPAHFEVPYYVVPAAGSGESGYALLREALRRTGRIGIAKVVLRTRQRLVAVLARGPMLCLEVLRYGEEVRGAPVAAVPGDDLTALGLAPAEVELAGLLVERMTETWDASAYRDEYRDAVVSVLEAKVAAGVGDLPLPGELDGTGLEQLSPADGGEAAGTAVADRIGLLERSLELAVAGERRPARRARAAREEAAARRSA